LDEQKLNKKTKDNLPEQPKFAFFSTIDFIQESAVTNFASDLSLIERLALFVARGFI